jgi:hypothetical protein
MAENWHPITALLKNAAKSSKQGQQRNGRDGGPRIAKPLYGLKPYRGSKETKTSMAERGDSVFKDLARN